jgi:hypothetical protein
MAQLLNEVYVTVKSPFFRARCKNVLEVHVLEPGVSRDERVHLFERDVRKGKRSIFFW